MSCPNCFCPACSAERQRWQHPVPMPYFPPLSPRTPPTFGDWWCTQCSSWHSAGSTCVTVWKSP